LASHPGRSFVALLQELRRGGLGRLANGSLDWHLRVLERTHRVVSIRSGRFRLYFPRAGPWAAHLRAYAFLHSSPTPTLARILIDEPDLTLKQIQARIPVGERNDLGWLRSRLRRFIQLGLAEPVRRGRENTYRPLPRLVHFAKTFATFRFPISLPLVEPVPLPGTLPRPVLPPPGAAPLSPFQNLEPVVG
jgi:hypothetical protein